MIRNAFFAYRDLKKQGGKNNEGHQKVTCIHFRRGTCVFGRRWDCICSQYNKQSFFLEDVGMTGRAIDHTQKTDASPIYLRLDDQTTESTHCYVSAYGCNSDGSGAVNLTFVNGSVVSNVVCRKGVQYSVHAKIYEEGYRYAFLTFSQLNYLITGDISGVWSADSTYRYTDAT